MDGPTIGLIVIAGLFLSGLGGMVLQAQVPTGSLTADTLAWVRRAVTALIVLAALAFGYVTLSVKASFEQAERDVKHLAGEVLELDRTLRRIGPDAAPARQLLFRYTNRVMKDVWPERHVRLPVGPLAAGELREEIRNTIDNLPAGSPARAANLVEARLHLQNIAATRLSIFENTGSPVSLWLKISLLAWLMIAFGSLGLTAPRSPIVVASLLLLAIVLGSAAFLMQEYDDPFKGVIVVSSTAMENALFTLAE